MKQDEEKKKWLGLKCVYYRSKKKVCPGLSFLKGGKKKKDLNFVIKAREDLLTA